MSDSKYWIIFTPPGQVPQTKGKFTDPFQVRKFLPEMKPHSPPETTYLVAHVLSEYLNVQNADEWALMHDHMVEAVEEESAYIKAGVCSGCGACNLKEAEKKCRPQAMGDSGEYGCPGEDLWEDERNSE